MTKAEGFTLPRTGKIHVTLTDSIHVIDIAERPEVYSQCGQVGRFIGRSENSSRRGKGNTYPASEFLWQYLFYNIY
jgi:hypothetical protein